MSARDIASNTEQRIHSSQRTVYRIRGIIRDCKFRQVTGVAAMDRFGAVTWWGFSPALHLLDEG